MRRCVEVERYIRRCEHVKILSWDTLSGTLLWVTLAGSSCGALFWEKFKLSREKMCRKREREGGCAGVTVWMCRCDIDAQMCGGEEVDLQM